MTTWLVDAGVLTPLTSATRNKRDWQPGHLVVSEIVASEAQTNNARNPRDQLLAAVDANGSRIVQVVALDASSLGGDMYYNHLNAERAGSPNHAGECESIALAAYDLPNTVFVSLDKGAIALALRELGPGRVAHAYTFARALHDDGVLSHTEFQSMCRALEKGQQRPPYLWSHPRPV